MTTTCPRHNNAVQFLELSKKLSSDLTRVLHVLENKFFEFSFKCFVLFIFMKELKDAILFQNHWRSQGDGPGRLGPYNRNATNNKSLTKKPCFFIFSFF